VRYSELLIHFIILVGYSSLIGLWLMDVNRLGL